MITRNQISQPQTNRLVQFSWMQDGKINKHFGEIIEQNESHLLFLVEDTGDSGTKYWWDICECSGCASSYSGARKNGAIQTNSID